MCGAALAAFAAEAHATGSELGAYRVVSGHVETDQRVLTAGAQGARLQYPSGLELKLSAGTQLQRLGAQPVWFASRGKTMAQLFEVRRGHLTAHVTRVDGKGTVPAVFRTDKKLTGVCLEGELAIEVAEQASVANLSGQAEVRKGTKWRDLNTGGVLYTVAGMPEPEARSLIAAPVWKGGRHLWSALQTLPKVGGFRWQPLSDARSYELAITEAGTGRMVHEAETRDSSLPDNSITLPAGSYQVRVRGFDGAGFPGAWSEPRSFSVLGFVPSGESYLGLDGVARIGSDGTLTFSNTQGLEMTYDHSAGWIEASSVVYLRREGRTLIAFRYPGDLDIVTVPAEAQDLHAEIEIGPAGARWPGPALALAVRLRDGADGRAAARVRPHIVTRVGVKHVELTWALQGDTWRATLPPQSGAGPWVVRVTVSHPDGAELGRELLEVSGKGAAPRPARRLPPQLVSAPPPVVDGVTQR